MRKIMPLCLLIVLSLMPAKSIAGVDFVLNVTPGFFLFSTSADGTRVYDSLRTDEVSGFISNIATLTGGVGFDTRALFIDIVGGAGYLYNASFSGPVYLMDVAFRFKMPSEVLTLGPHFSYMVYNLDWDGNVNVSLAENAGVVAGLGLTVGTKPFSFVASIDYVNATFGVDSSESWVHNDDLDLSGLALQIGVIFRF